MASKAKSPRGRGRGRGKAAKVVIEEENGDVPELDGPPPPIIEAPATRASLRLNSTSLASEDEENGDITEVPVSEKSKAESDDESPLYEKMEVIDTEELVEETKEEEIEDVPPTAVEDVVKDAVMDVLKDDINDVLKDDVKDVLKEAVKDVVEDAEMLSEDELMPETKEPLDTEAVSDDDLKEEGMPDTEAVSDDELPEDKRNKAKVAEAEAVSEDELPDDLDKKSKPDSTNGATEDGRKEKKRKAEADYDPSSPTSENSGDGSPAPKKAALGDTKSETETPGKKPLPELEKYWKAVKDDPSDFTGWTYLLQYVDQENDIDVAREAYDSFLAHYPYCYGYWRKYADYEKRKGNSEECEKVFERGLKAIPLSVDLWLHYLNYIKAAYIEDKEYVRVQFERALDACGLEFRSDRLWESYIKWEKERKNLINITAIYDRLLAIPTQGYTTHFDTFQDHVNGNPPQTILPVDDFLELRREVVLELKQNEKSSVVTLQAPGDDAPPGEDADPDKEQQSVANSTQRMEEETNALREKILSSRRKVHKATVTAVAARWNYEEGIKRPYFHVKPLERCQLKNWKEYLEFEVEQGDHPRVVTLFERALIACALYEEFWVRFIRYLESIPGDQTTKVRDVYERACLIHHKKKPNLHLQWAVFEEASANYDKAATILENVETTIPNMLQVAYRRINLERRRCAYERACSLYEEYIAANKNKSAIVTNMTVKYARFVWKFLNDIDRAVDILEKALDRDRENTRLYLQLIDMGLQKNPVDETRIVSILDQFLDKEGDLDQKVMFAQRKIEFLEDFGSSIEKVQKAQDEFQKYIKQVKEKKKKSEGEPPVPPPATPTSSKKSKSDSTANTAAGPPMPNVPPPSNTSGSTYPPYQSNYYGGYPQGGSDQNYPNNYPAGYNNYSNWNNYPQGNYSNYGQSGWPTGYYPPSY